MIIAGSKTEETLFLQQKSISYPRSKCRCPSAGYFPLEPAGNAVS
jgi:hypothetical protein